MHRACLREGKTAQKLNENEEKKNVAKLLLAQKIFFISSVLVNEIVCETEPDNVTAPT